MNGSKIQSPVAVANFFIQKSFDTGKELTPMKLVKLVYIAHGWHLGLTDQPLIDEVVQAWKYGPVISSVYHNFKYFANSQITSLKHSSNPLDPGIPSVDDEKERQLLNKIWEVYGDMSGLQLSTLTHQPNTPWDIIYNQKGGKELQSAIIPNDLIKEHYKIKINASRKSAEPV